MSKAPDESRVQANRNLSILGLTFSGLGMATWLALLAVLVFMPYEEKTGDSLRDLSVGFGNAILFVLRLAAGVTGLSIGGGLSLMGLVSSLVALKSNSGNRLAWYGLYLGAAGLLFGLAIVIWRSMAVSSWG